MIIVPVTAGKLTAKGRLSVGTRLKLRCALVAGKVLHSARIEYLYVFSQGAVRPFHVTRPCDTMSAWVLMRDPYCPPPLVPDREHNLCTQPDREQFVLDAAQARKATILGFRTLLEVRKHERLQEVVSETEMDLDVYPVTNNVVPIRRRP